MSAANPPPPAEPPAIIRSAKECFMASPHAAEMKKIIQSGAFEAACHYSLLVLLERQPTAFADPSKSWDAGCVMSGARQVLDILAHLALPEQEKKPLKSDRLKYEP